MKTTTRGLECNTFVQKAARKVPGTDQYVRPKFGMSYLPGNRDAYFSITAGILQVAPWGGFSNVGGGCCHERIVQAFPELAELVPFHLWDQDGRNMHYVANAVYWAELELGISKWQERTAVPHGYDTFFDVLASHVGADVLGDREQVREELRAFGCRHSEGLEKTARGEFERFLERRVPALKAAFDKAMAKFGVKGIHVIDGDPRAAPLSKAEQEDGNRASALP
jgi:hypothetical protein